ncbi:unnamed protein product [Ceratitis capitata]|uniref:(Mediterranean fruit fly) hypothetical protein n=1 Tax=Ceratitis capitata TaxID=7213 RepID=A0A811UQ45_CERCA|nr:unnamed protein product [Ceratitis capitata]
MQQQILRLELQLQQAQARNSSNERQRFIEQSPHIVPIAQSPDTRANAPLHDTMTPFLQPTSSSQNITVQSTSNSLLNSDDMVSISGAVSDSRTSHMPGVMQVTNPQAISSNLAVQSNSHVTSVNAMPPLRKLLIFAIVFRPCSGLANILHSVY